MDHKLGQYRAELFDELIARLLAAMYPDARLTRKTALRVPQPQGASGSGSVGFRTVSLDFRVSTPSGYVVVETKAPYTVGVAEVVNAALRRLKAIIKLLAASRIKTAILAIPIELPTDSRDVLEETRLAAGAAGTAVEVLDEGKLLALVREHLSAPITSFSVEELQKVLGIKAVPQPEVVLQVGLREEVVVLMADFCSYTRFVQESGGKHALIESVMARFYREMRNAIKDDGGYLDKYIGDGVLAYWFGHDAGTRLEKCVQRLMGIAVNLADEWEDHIDFSIEPKGLRAGAAIGPVLFVSEEMPPNSRIHAIGDAVNIAARLQGEADPNSLVVTHLLWKRFFDTRGDFEEVGPFKLKNFNHPIRARRKTFGKNGV